MNNIRTRLFLTYFLLILFTIGLMGTLFYVLTKEHLLKSKDSYLENAAEFFLKFITPSVSKEEDLGPATRFFIRQCWEHMDYQLQVIDRNGDIISDSSGMPPFPGKGEKRFLIALRGKPSSWTEKINEEQLLARCVPIKIRGEIIGAAKLSISLEEFDAMFAVLKRDFFLTFFLSLCAALGMALLFIRTLMRPVARIRDTARRIARGDLTSRVNYKSSDELGDLSMTINFMAEELRKLEQARSEFLGNVSHELKTPLTIIKGFVITLLGSPDLNKEWVRSLEMINREADRLTRLVNELLELTRLRSGRVELHLLTCEARELFTSVQAQMEPKSEALGVALRMECVETVPRLFIDPDRFKEVLINLIDNALKYTPKGGTVEVSALVRHEAFQVVVKDNGPGISEDEIPYIFERFFRGSARNQKVEGTGLGLAIVKEIVAAHGGDIKVESKTGVGTIFMVTLPFRSPGTLGDK
ncbi:MAG: HAMP domain-containing sensor histidine kinase [Candidatus Eremiobacteraeota bacterium]|nr:HAMP domain-containing sensor histidine kinase [Candidatus Eremiobacteraeota bacterium]